MSNRSGYGGSGSLFGGGWNWGGGETRAHSEATADAIANGSGANEAHYSQGYVDSRVALDKAITGSLMGAYVEMVAGQKTLSFGIDFDFYLGIDNGPFAGHTLVAEIMVLEEINIGNVGSAALTIALKEIERKGIWGAATGAYLTISTAPLGDLISPSTLGSIEAQRAFEMEMAFIREDMEFQESLDRIDRRAREIWPERFK